MCPHREREPSVARERATSWGDLGGGGGQWVRMGGGKEVDGGRWEGGREGRSGD